MTDYEERLKDELTLIPALTELQEQVKGRIRAARELVRELPIPQSATVRKSLTMWESPSQQLRERFPLLFSHSLPKVDDNE